MTLEEISYVGQAVAAIAVLVSLAAVYGQLKQNNKIARADLTQSIWLRASQPCSAFTKPVSTRTSRTHGGRRVHGP